MPMLDHVFPTQNLHRFPEFQWQAENRTFLHYQRFVQSVVFDVDAASLLLEKVLPRIRRTGVLPACLEQRYLELNHLGLTGGMLNDSREQDGACELSER